jgi:hypothetical protein
MPSTRALPRRVLLRFALPVRVGSDGLAPDGFRELFEIVFFCIGQVLPAGERNDLRRFSLYVNHV